MATIVFSEVEEWEQDFLMKTLIGHTVYFANFPFDSMHQIPPEMFTAEVLSPFIYSQLTPQLLSLFPNLKYITTRSTGFDHIDLAYCKQRGIGVSNVPSYGAHSVAEHAFALILAIAKNLLASIEQAKKGDFSTANLTGFELYGKTLGIIGTGKIGSTMVQIAKGFGMHVVAYSHHAEPNLESMGVTFVQLPELLQTADVVSIHVPETEETKHMINKGNINQFKKGSILINTARGGIVETEAILQGIQEGILAGVGLDVLEEECNIREERELLTKEFLQTCDLKTQLMNHMLLTRKEVIITPHNAFNSKESLQEILQVTEDNISSFLSGNPKNIVSS
ncbi:MAG TPA: NAD(P)-dependent oxidoreductase [Patescibacteria group bacterium]